MRNFIFYTLFVSLNLLCGKSVFSQERGNLNLHYGTLAVYNTYAIGYELFDLLKNSERHHISPLIRIGGWNSSISEKNRGFQSSFGFSYLLGKKNHHLELTNEIVAHFDKGLKGQDIVYIGSLYRPFLGYRYQSVSNKFIGRFGFGWKELLQIGIGFKL